MYQKVNFDDSKIKIVKGMRLTSLHIDRTFVYLMLPAIVRF